MDNIMRALHAFIKINALEAKGVEYIERLSECAKICETEEVFDKVGKLFNNQRICSSMISWLESTF